MGIGFALASGLVQGFTQNIGREMERRQTERDRLTAIENAILTASVGKDFNNQNVNAIQQMVRSSRQQLADQEGIDIFGTRGDDIISDDAMSNLIGSLQSTVEEDEIEYHNLAIGPATLKVNEKYVDPQSSPEDQASMFFDAINTEFLTAEGRDTFFNQFQTEEDKKALENFFISQGAQIVRARMYGTEGGKEVVIDPSKQIPRYEDFANFLGWDSDKQFKQASANVAAKLGVEEVPQTHIVLPVSLQGGEGAAGMMLSSVGITTDKQIEGLNGLAGFHGMDRNKFIFSYAQQFTDRNAFVKGLGHAVNLFNIGAAEPRSQATNEAVGDYLMTHPDLKNDALARAYAMTPILAKVTNPVDMNFSRLGIQVAEEKAFADEFKEITGQSIDVFKTRSQSLRKAGTNIRSLIEIVERTDVKVEGLVANTFQTIFGFAGEGGTLDQIKNFMTRGGDFATDADSANITSFMASELEGVSKDVAAARTLAFIAAADLARAEDEGGRLSDQDFLRNYQKLGVKSSGGIPAQISAMKTVLNEVVMKEREIEVLEDIVSRGEGGTLREGDRMLLRGDARAKFFVNQYYDAGGQAPSISTPEPAALPQLSDIQADPERYTLYRLVETREGGQIYTDSQTRSLIITQGGVVTRVIPQDQAANYLQKGIADETLKRNKPSTEFNYPVPDSDKSMVVTDVATRKGTLGDGGTFAPSGAAPTPEPTPAPTPAPAPAPERIPELSMTGKKVTGNNERGHTLEGYEGKFRKVIPTDGGDPYFERMGQ
jgi:hypothetical protein